IILAWMQQRTKNSVEAGTKASVLASDKAAVKVEQVAAKQADAVENTGKKLEEMAKVGIATHMLANSAMGEQKRLLAVKARAMANELPTPANIAEADAAEQVWAEHQRKQAVLDIKELGDKNKGE